MPFLPTATCYIHLGPSDNCELSSSQGNHDAAQLCIHIPGDRNRSLCSGFGWEHWNGSRWFSPTFVFPAVGLACLWFALDEFAVSMGFWDFPPGGPLPLRILRLPIEEYIIFGLHPIDRKSERLNSRHVSESRMP